MTKRCSHCNHDGHNSRTCPNRGVRLFGVRITDGSMRKSASTGNLAVLERSAAGGGGLPPTDLPDPSPACFRGSGYASDSLHGSSGSRERKKGSPWTEHEHRMFLLGLKKLGKGNWRGIAHNYVMSRTPTQVASHAQKYFIRHSATNRRKRRVSLFDIAADEPTPTENLPSSSQEQEIQDSSLLPVSQISDEQADMEMDYSTIEVDETVSAPPATTPPAAMKYSNLPPFYPVFIPLTVPQDSNDHVGMKYNNTTGEVEGVVTAPPTTMQFSYTPTYPGFFSPGLPCPMLYWPACTAQAAVPLSKIVKPMAVHSKTPIDVDELCGMSRQSLVLCDREAGPLTPAPKIPGSSEKQTAFHGSASTGGSSLDSSSSPIHAI